MANERKTPEHVRIGRIKDQINVFQSDADQAKMLADRYRIEGNEVKTAYWESQYEYATRTVVRMAAAFQIPFERDLLQAR